jgi:antitoxin YokJ
MTIDEILDQIESRSDCVVLPPCGLPSIKSSCALPDEIARFYQLCGGVKIRRFNNHFFSWEVVQPTRFIPAPEVAHRDFYDTVEMFWREHWAQSLYWFAQTEGAGEAIVVDCRPGAPLRLLNADIETFGCEAMPLVSDDLGGLLVNLLEAKIASLPIS